MRRWSDLTSAVSAHALASTRALGRPTLGSMRVALAIAAIAVALLGAWQIALPTLSYVYLALAQGHPVLRTTLAAWELRWTGRDRAQIDEHTWLVIDADTGPRVWVERIAAERGLVVVEQMGS